MLCMCTSVFVSSLLFFDFLTLVIFLCKIPLVEQVCYTTKCIDNVHRALAQVLQQPSMPKKKRKNMLLFFLRTKKCAFNDFFLFFLFFFVCLFISFPPSLPLSISWGTQNTAGSYFLAPLA